jgi:very-short-patch-repair endonuclease
MSPMGCSGWRRVGEIAEKQFGLVTVEQLADCEISKYSTRRAITAGRLFRVHAGVYSVGHPIVERRAHLLSAPLALGPEAAISHSSSAEHLGILPMGGSLVEVTVPERGGRSRRGIRVHFSAISASERLMFRGIPCTDASRTIIDLAATQPGRLERAIREAGALGILDVDRILELLGRYPARRGCRAVRSALGIESLPVFTREELERQMYILCRSHNLPLPDMNIELDAPGGPYEVDCVWADFRLVIECDSRWHDNPVTQRRDTEREQALTLMGWRVYRLRWHQIVGEPERTARTVRHLLDEQRRLIAVA